MIEQSDDPGLIARTAAAYVAALGGLAYLTAGDGVEAATHYAGGKTVGVVVRPDLVRIHIVVRELPIAAVVERVRETTQRALGTLGAERPVEVVVEDVELDQLPSSLRGPTLPPPEPLATSVP